MAIDKPTVVLKRFSGNYFSEFCSHLKHLQSFVVAFIAQVQSTEKSKASVVEVYRVSPL